MVYFKFIGKNNGNYPYRIGLNTLKYNGETFDTKPICNEGGLYFTDAKNIFEFLVYGNTLCVVSLPEDARIVKINNKWKADKIIIEEQRDIRNVETWKFLIEENGVDIQFYNNYPLRWASKHGYLEVVKYLVESGIVIQYSDLSLKWASKNGHLEIAKFLVENGA